MAEADIEIILERAKERYPEAKPRIISDNGSQFIAKDFKEFIRISGMTHVRTSTVLPSIERKNRTLAQITQSGVHPPRDAAVGLHHAEGHARRVSAGDSDRAGSKIGGGEGTAEESPPARRVTDETDYFRLADDPGAIATHSQAKG
jgi:hypothetical protein